MNSSVILLLSTDPFVERAAREAVPATRHVLRVIQSSQEAFLQLKEGCDDIDLAIIDLDPGMHATAFLEAAGDRLPMIVLTSLEENYMRPIAARHGAVACLAKPFTAERLEKEIARILRDSSAAA
jgi:DNA-binding NtrC family response regulator